ncbi:hypothetical protein PV350_45460 [Streptomyces sp. PA03-6a]|nr:hypothetical protein [Streptomyces sp. PA03-6a]
MPDLSDDQLDDLMAAIGLVPPATRGPNATKPCGTAAAYARHLRHGETPCEDCRRANREYKKGGGARAKRQGQRKPINHGTTAGYQQHRYRGEAPCEACREAMRVKSRERYYADPEQSRRYVRDSYSRRNGGAL